MPCAEQAHDVHEGVAGFFDVMHPVRKLLGECRKVGSDFWDLGRLAWVVIPAVEYEGDASLIGHDLRASGGEVLEQFQHVAGITVHDGLPHDLDHDQIMLDRGFASQWVAEGVHYFIGPSSLGI